MTPARIEGPLLALREEPLDTVHGPFRLHAFHNLTSGHAALAVTTGAVTDGAPLLARVHSSCVTSEAFGACDCDCAEQLDGALAQLAAEGRGVLFYLTQEGRGAGFAAKARDRMLVQASRNRLTTFDAYTHMGLAKDQRRYDEVAAVCRLLGVTAPLLLLTNNPEKLSALVDVGVPVADHRPLAVPPSPWSRHYLTAKSRSGHLLADRGGDATLPPEPVEAFEPHPLPAAPGFLRLASYLLPIADVTADEPAWFRLHLYLDAARRKERVVLTHGALDGAPPPLVHLQRERVVERFPLHERACRATWRAAAAAIVRHGAGCTLFVDEHESVDEALGALLAGHLPRGSALALGELPPPLREALAARGVRLGPGTPA